jgi:hypothetical protein
MGGRTCFIAILAALAALPATADAATQWLDPVPVSPAGGDVTDNSSDVAMSANGDTVAVWVRGAVLEASFRPAGGTFGPVESVPVTSDATGVADPFVAFDGSTAVMVFFEFTNGPGFAVARAVRNPDGTYGEAKTISTPGRYAAEQFVAGNAAGDVVAFWLEAEGSARYFATAFRPAGATDFEAPATFPTGSDLGYDGAVDSAGNAIVVWDDGTTIKSTSRPAGGSFGDAAPVVTEAEDVNSPSIAVSADGTAVVTYRRYDPTVSGPNETFGHNRAWATVRAADASAFGPPQDVSANDYGTLFTGAAVDGRGDAIALYQAGSQPWAAVAPPGGVFGDAVRLSPAAHDMYAPQMEVAGDGSTHIG